MSQNYNRGSSNLGFGPNLGPSSNNYNNPPTNQYTMYGYGNNPNQKNVNPNINSQSMQSLNIQTQQSSWGNNPQLRTQNTQFQNIPQSQNPYDKPNQWIQPTTSQWTQPNSSQWNQPPITNVNQSNPYDQPQQPTYRETIKYPSLQESQKSKSAFGSLFQQAGGVNNLSQQMGSLNINKQSKDGMNIWADLVKAIDWDTLIKKKNVAKQQSDTAWVTYQEQSWLQPQPSKTIQIETDRKFSFPNPYIKYKIIPGVDQKMALDVTSKDNLEKGLVRGNLIIWDYHGGPNQQFYIHRLPKNQQSFNYQNNGVENDEFILINASTGFVVSALNLTVKSAKKQNPSQLCVFPKMKDNRNQRWRLKPVSEKGDIFIIQSVQTGNVLDVQGASRTNGANVLQWEQNRQKNQLWKILPA